MSETRASSRLSPEAGRTLASVLDVLVPPRDDVGLPGAGTLGVGGRIEEGLRERPELRAPLAAGLAAAEEEARGRGAAAFAALPDPERPAVLEALATRVPGFLGLLTFLAYGAYYQEPRVLEALGLEARPPFPEGHEIPPTDFAILEPVRRRAAMYRKP
jgi:hypothetical protein